MSLLRGGLSFPVARRDRRCLYFVGEWWRITGNPDLDSLTSPDQQPVDFGIWQAQDGSWQLWSCIRKTKEGGRSRLFHGWEAEDLTDKNWRPSGIKMRANTLLGEEQGGLQAPYVVRTDGEYLMLYGDWNRICLAKSEDGRSFTRHLRNGSPALFGDSLETNTRDAMVIAHDDHWICYNNAHPNDDGAIYARTSTDLIHWTESKVLSYGGRVGTGKFWQAECPFVVKRKGRFYLFRTSNYGAQNKTHIYTSLDPLDFGIHDDRHYLGSLPVAAPEIFRFEGEWYMAALLPTLDGIRMTKMDWKKH